jgi:aspartate/methionine/tyrosine aminotransferase
MNFRELKEAGVSANPPEGTYYFMPDFAACRSQAIPDGTALCKKLLKEANVAVSSQKFFRPTSNDAERYKVLQCCHR